MERTFVFSNRVLLDRGGLTSGWITHLSLGRVTGVLQAGFNSI